uniref:Carboxylesterase type B domain-containing protein n=1 Tax=Strigamia maritima TaxID=126957 RepID=T1JGH5_STRMM
MNSRYLYLILFVSLVHSDDAPTLSTSTGQVIGSRQKTSIGTDYFAYEGIRYGVANRFQEPQEPPISSQITVAMISPLACPQWDHELAIVRGTEDCLYLSVFTPSAGFPNGNSSLFPVVLVVPGWHFVASARTRPQQLVDKGIIVVSVNYRLGILGFLSTNDSSAAGNWGLLDLRLSLRWVQKNIKNFGGDPQRVTLMGHDSGGALVSYLLMDHEIQEMKMIVGAITMSGNSLCPWAVQKKPLSNAHLIAQGLNCNIDSTAELVKCISEAEIQDLVLLENNIHRSYASFPLIAAPSVDAGLRQSPAVANSAEYILQNGFNFTKVPLVSGIVKDEGAHVFAEMILQHWPEILYEESYFEKQFLPGLLRALGRFQENINEILTLTKYHYFHESSNVDARSTVAIRSIEMISDILYNHCNTHWSKLYHKAAQADVYAYKFEHHGQISTMDFIINELKKYNKTEQILPYLQNVVSHGDEIIYILDDEMLKNEDKKVQTTMTDLWAHFIQHQKMPLSWPSITDTEYSYVSIDGPQIKKNIEHSDLNQQFLHYLYSLPENKWVHHTEKYTGNKDVEKTETSSSLPHIDLTTAIWCLAAISMVLLTGMCVFIFLYINQRKKQLISLGPQFIASSREDL